MATSTSNLAQSNSTFANYAAWATAISAAFASFGWLQQNDTGQVVWTATVLTITDVTASGGNAIYSFSSYTGPAPRIGMSVIITGFATGANNVTATITALTGSTSGTFTVVKVSQSNETHAASGTTTAVSTVPGTATLRDYEIWLPGDGLTAFYVKMEYGTAGASTPCVRLSIATGTNGAGTLSGTVTTTVGTNTGNTSNSTTLVECDFSGSASRFGALLWRAGSFTTFIGIERSVDSSGAYSGAGVGLWFEGPSSQNIAHRSIGFLSGVGSTPALGVATTNSFPRINTGTGSGSSTQVGNNVSTSPGFADWGSYSNAFTLFAIGTLSDFIEGATVTATQYGVSRTYIVAKSNDLNALGNPGGNNQTSFLFRYD